MTTKLKLRGELNLVQFMEWILRIALKMTSGLSLTASEKLEFVLNEHVIRYSQSGIELRDRIESKSMTKMLSNLQRYLFEAFCYFAASKANGNGTDRSNKAVYVPLLRIDGFMAMLEELQLIGTALTRNTIKSIFRRAQYQDEKRYASPFADDPTLKPQSPGAGLLSTQCLLHFDAFIECLVVVAIHKKPDPYLGLETRVEEFLVNSVIDPLFQQNKISMPFKPKKTKKYAVKQRKRRKMKNANSSNKQRNRSNKQRRATVSRISTYSKTSGSTMASKTKIKKKRNSKS